MISLQMLRPHLDDLPSLDAALAILPPGYRLRTYQPGDEAAWAAIMNTGQMDTWDAARTREKLTGCPWPQFDPAGLFLITHGPHEQPVGSACCWLRDPAEPGILHMVCVLPEHRGSGLSLPLCLAVLHRFRDRGYQQVQLSTHDWRLGAIKVYLRLGFQPLLSKPEHPAAWAEVVRALGWETPLSPIEKAAS